MPHHEHAHAHSAAHGHEGHDHAGHAHAHGGCAPVARPASLFAALAVAIAAELVHFFAPDTLAWRAASMALAACAIALSGLSVFRAGLAALGRGQLNINALMTVAVSGAFLIGQWP